MGQSLYNKLPVTFPYLICNIQIPWFCNRIRKSWEYTKCKPPGPSSQFHSKISRKVESIQIEHRKHIFGSCTVPIERKTCSKKYHSRNYSNIYHSNGHKQKLNQSTNLCHIMKVCIGMNNIWILFQQLIGKGI